MFQTLVLQKMKQRITQKLSKMQIPECLKSVELEYQGTDIFTFNAPLDNSDIG